MNLFEYNYQKKLDEVLSTGKKRSYFVAAITVFFILLMSFAGIIPALSSLGTQHEENGKRDAIIGKLETKLDILKSFVKEEDDKKSLISFLNNIFPDKFPEKDSLNKLVDLETKNHLVIASYIFQNPIPGSQEQVNSYTSVNTKVLSMSFSGEGTLTDVQNFIKDVEESRRILDITEVVISRKVGDDLAQTSEGRDFDLTMSVNLYYYDLTAKDPKLEG